MTEYELFAHFKKLVLLQVQNSEEIFVAVFALVRFFPGVLSLVLDLKQVLKSDQLVFQWFKLIDKDFKGLS